MSVEQYLLRHAEPEARLADSWTTAYQAVLVVPAFDEAPALLSGLSPACRVDVGGRRVLVVVVVNAPVDAAPSARASNQRLLQGLALVGRTREPLGMNSLLLDAGSFDLLVVDRSSSGCELPAKQGVGLARKLGADLALRLWAQSRVASPWIFTSDADATLPTDYFERAAAPGAPLASRCAALLYPFVHLPGGTPSIDRATALYEATLRYHVLGLAFAGSPYAYHSMGSALAVSAEFYAKARGFPKLRAGEDFYLLDKLAKLAPIRRLTGKPIALRARDSSRAPFGTGARVRQILQRGTLEVASPDAYLVLGKLLYGLNQLVESRELRDLQAEFSALPAAARQAAGVALARSGLQPACRQALNVVGTGSLSLRLHTWFDALRTLRFLHALRDAGIPEVEYRAALSRAPFTAGVARVCENVDESLVQLRALEAELTACGGPNCPRPR